MTVRPREPAPGDEREGSLEICMAQKANMEAIFHSVADGILTLDTNLRIVHLNRAAESILGAPSEQAAGRPVSEVLPGRLWDVAELVRTTLATGQGAEARENLIGAAGEREVRVLLTTSRLRDRRGDVGGAVVVLRDITHERDLESRLGRRGNLHGLVGRSHAMQELYELIEDVARTDSTVLIHGESGSGKELAADAIHRASPRAGGPFVKVNCSALSEGLLESELFGHVKGAFTGAHHDRVGRFELADRGTLLLDEIGDLPPSTQVKLLRVLQEREIERVGDSRVRKVDVRILAATHQPLRDLVEQKRFREDLFYRLNVIPVRLPALREHREDIPSLVASFLDELRDVTGKRAERVSPDAMRVLMDHAWPGNVRELRNAVEHALVKSRGPTLLVEDLPRELLESAGAPPPTPKRPAATDERARLLEALERAHWNRTAAARALGIDRSTLWRRMRKLELTPNA